MNWLQKTITQFNRIHGTSHAIDMSEAEFTAEMENHQTVIEAIEMSGDQTADFESRLTALENKTPEGFVSQEAYDTKVGELNSSIQTLETTVATLKATTETNSTAISTAKTELATEINSVKGTQSGTQTTDVNGDPITGKLGAVETEDKSKMSIDMAEVFQGEIVPGLGL